jgi:hypothetical protein
VQRQLRGLFQKGDGGLLPPLTLPRRGSSCQFPGKVREPAAVNARSTTLRLGFYARADPRTITKGGDMVIIGIAGLVGFAIGFFAGAGYATRGASTRRDEAERYVVECDELREDGDHMRQSRDEPASGVVPKEQIEALRKLAG